MKKNNLKIFISVAVCMLFILVLWMYFLKLNFREIDKKANQEKDFFWRDLWSFDIKIEENQEIKDSFNELNEMLNSTSTTTTLDILEEELNQERASEVAGKGEVLGARDEQTKIIDEEFRNKLLERVKEVVDQKQQQN
jgi:hypothetical protein